MADVAPATPKAKKAPKPAKKALHPKYSEMIADAIKNLKTRGGSSKAAIYKFIAAKYTVGDNKTQINSFLKTALKSGVKAGTIKQAKGVGASGSFKLGEVKAVAKPKKATKPKAAKAKKPKSPKKAAKKPAAKKAAAAKKPAAKKAAAKPKKAKTPKKASK